MSVVAVCRKSVFTLIHYGGHCPSVLSADHRRRVRQNLTCSLVAATVLNVDAVQAMTIPPDHLRALTERIEQMREAERTRIARELHDELGQLLTGIKLDFSATVKRLRELKTPGDVVDRLQSAIGQIDLGIAMVRRIASDLRPAALDHRDLGGAIEDEARRVAAKSGLRIHVNADLHGEVP